MVKRFVSKFYLYLILFFLYVPILVLVCLSFNASRSRVVWGGFTLNWYSELFSNSQIMEALWTTISIGLLASAIATVIGLLGAVGIDAMRKKGYSISVGAGNITLMNADIVTGIALMLWFARFFELGYTSVLLAHVTFCIPYVLLSILPKLRQLDVSVYEAARDLGAGTFTAFIRVIFPQLIPAVISGFFMSLTMSMDDFVVTYFTKGAGINTLSTMIYGQIRKGIKPEMYALSTIIFAIILVILILVNFVPEIAEKRRKRG
ncbi:MAG TPA: ABC transporter permease [Candidatus Eubacterium avistercoris]|uniref:ABC transporter permease n=1 Tax=Candidatus Eubacterium avistercoris TaxID=2838567 RepID=A0A9D2D2P1_9FIRM|nr:ABC transporter permease [Candidatus Eubacterium avistercoris]